MYLFKIIYISLSPTLPPPPSSPSDYIIRFITMALKSLIAAMLFSILPSRKKGKWYMLLEYVSQFYRTLAPTPLWVRYLSNQHLSGAVFAVLITATYLMIKGGVIFSSVRELYGAFINFLKDPVSDVCVGARERERERERERREMITPPPSLLYRYTVPHLQKMTWIKPTIPVPYVMKISPVPLCWIAG